MSTAFNFDEWIELNNFEEIKDILVRHNLNIRKNLSTQSRQFALFLSDSTLLATKSHLITNIVQAIQLLSFAQTANHKNINKSSYIVISEAEEDILKSLQSTLDVIKTKHSFNKKLNKKYKNSIINMEHRKKEKLINTKRKIDSYFDKIFNEIRSTKQAILEKLHLFQEQNIDERGKNTILSESAELIKTANIAVSSGLNKCNHIIQHSLNKSRDDRKKQIINISDESMREYNKMKKALKTNTKSIENAIQENNSIIFDIDFEGNIQQTQEIIINALKSIQLTAFNEVEGYGEGANEQKIHGNNYNHKSEVDMRWNYSPMSTLPIYPRDAMRGVIFNWNEAKAFGKSRTKKNGTFHTHVSDMFIASPKNRCCGNAWRRLKIGNGYKVIFFVFDDDRGRAKKIAALRNGHPDWIYAEYLCDTHK